MGKFYTDSVSGEQSSDTVGFTIGGGSDLIDTNAPYSGYVSMGECILSFVEDTPKPERVIFNEAGQTTIVYWSDGEKTVVRTTEGDVFDKEVGLAMSYLKKFVGSRRQIAKMIESAYVQEVREEE